MARALSNNWVGTDVWKTEIANRPTSSHFKSAEDKWVLWPRFGKSGNSVFIMFHGRCNPIQFLEIYGLGAGEGSRVASAISSEAWRPCRDPGRGSSSVLSLLFSRHFSAQKWQAAMPRDGECSTAPFDFISFCLCLISYKSFPHPADPPKSLVLKKKKHRKVYTKAATWEEWGYKDKRSIITEEFSQPLPFI